MAGKRASYPLGVKDDVCCLHHLHASVPKQMTKDLSRAGLDALLCVARKSKSDSIRAWRAEQETSLELEETSPMEGLVEAEDSRPSSYCMSTGFWWRLTRLLSSVLRIVLEMNWWRQATSQKEGNRENPFVKATLRVPGTEVVEYTSLRTFAEGVTTAKLGPKKEAEKVSQDLRAHGKARDEVFGEGDMVSIMFPGKGG